MTCTARIRPFLDDTEVACELDDDEEHDAHTATLRDYAYPGSSTALVWHENDRRNFHDHWPGRCAHIETIETTAPGATVETFRPGGQCTLPDGHPGNHAP